ELRQDAERVRPGSAAAPLTGPDADAQEKLASVLEGAGLSPPRVDELPALLAETPQRTQQLRKSLAAKGRAVKVSEELWFGAAPLRELRARVADVPHQIGRVSCTDRIDGSSAPVCSRPCK